MTPAEVAALEAAAEAREACAKLSPRQREVLVLLCKSVPRKDIGAHVNLSESTVLGMFKDIFRRLEVHSAVEAAVVATKAGLV